MEQQIATFAIKKGLAQMLKGGVIMDVVTPDHAKIAEDAGACAVMALGTSSRLIFGLRRCCPHERSGRDHEDHGHRHHPGHGKMPHRAFRGGADPRIDRRGLY